MKTALCQTRIPKLVSACTLWPLLALAPHAFGDMLVDNVNGYTLDAAGELQTFSYLVVNDEGRISHIGTGTPPVADRRIDGAGHTLLPGVIDVRGRPFELAMQLTRLNLSDALTRDEAVEQIRSYAAAHPEQPWVFGYGWRPEALSPIEGLESALVDLAERPIFLLRNDGLAAWTNSAASRIAGVDFARVITGREMQRVRKAIPPPDEDVLQHALDDAFSTLSAVGITALHDHDANRSTIARYEQRLARGDLPLRIYATLNGINELEAFGKPATTANDELVVRGVRLTAGSMLNQGAAMLLEDSARDLGLPMINEAELVRQIETARRDGFQVDIDAQGTGMLVALNAFAAAGASAEERHWIENVSEIAPGDADYAKQLGIIGSIQPTPPNGKHAAGDPPDAAPWRELAAAGVVVAAGSGFPAGNANPFLAWHALTTGANAMTAKEAFRTLTWNPAYAMRMEDSIGSLEVGKWADFVLVDQDPFQIDPGRLPEIIVLATWVGGRDVWKLASLDIEPPIPVAPNIDLSQPVDGSVELEPPEIAAGPLPAVPPVEDTREPFRILGAEVPARTSTRLTWSPGEYIEIASGTAPVLVVHGSRPGPVLCLTGAIHGDELNGIEVVREVLYGLDAHTLSGTVIGVPIVNVEGFRRGSRYLVDRRDLNRHFPGNPKGSSASRIAHSLFQEVISKCDALVDVHTGSFQRTNLPQVRANLLIPAIARIANSFREMVILQSSGGEGTLRYAAAKAGIPAITIETGAPMELQPSAVADGVRGIRALLSDLGMDRRVRLWGNPEPVYYGSEWIRANRGGVLLSKVKLGQYVRRGEVLGSITDPITNISSDVYAPGKGRILGMALNQIVMPGFAMYRLGIESRDPAATSLKAEPDELEDDS